MEAAGLPRSHQTPSGCGDGVGSRSALVALRRRPPGFRSESTSVADSVEGHGVAAIALLRATFAPSYTLDAFERLLWWLFAGSAGAKTRGLVILAIRREPRNAQQLSDALHLDYTTVRHHLRVLEENHIVITEGETYGKLYFVSDSMEAHWKSLEAILEKAKGRRQG